jgi:LysR family hydrogen peroxide-inducible transcriptional activator
MTTAQLRYLLAVAKHQNFSKAAKELGVTQPTLSMQIRNLEDELGIRIFDRSVQPMRITPIGKKIIDQARVILHENDKIVEMVKHEKGIVAGEFRLGIIPTVIGTLLPIFLKDFLKRYPDVKLQIEERTTAQILEGLRNNELDAGIAATPLEEDDIIEMPLYNEPFVGFIPEGHRLYGKEKLHDQDLAVEDILLLEEGHCFRDNILNICKSHLPDDQPYTLDTGNFTTLVKLAKEGMGMTLLPYLHTLDLRDEDKALLKTFEKPEPAREISLIIHADNHKKGIVNALRHTIRGIIKGLVTFHNVRIISPLPPIHQIK